jgi:LysR family glycine cleavage system transcriptional activator
VSLSETGLRLAPAVTDSFARLRAAFDELTQTADGVLAISALITFATNWLVPRLGSFHFAHPDIAVKLDVSQKLVDLTRSEFDIGIRSGKGEWPGLVAHGLFGASYTPMLSPRMLESSGPLKEPIDLLKLPLIDPTDDWWPEWFAAAGVPDVDLSHRTGLRLLNQQLAGRAAVAGQGVAILMPAFFPDELASGQLVQPFPVLRQSPETHYWLVYAEARRRVPKIRAFRDWLLAEVRAGAQTPPPANVRAAGETTRAPDPVTS